MDYVLRAIAVATLVAVVLLIWWDTRPILTSCPDCHEMWTGPRGGAIPWLLAHDCRKADQ